MATGTSCLALLTAVLLLYPSGAMAMPRKEGSHSALNDIGLTLFSGTETVVAKWDPTFPRATVTWQDQHGGYEEIHLKNAAEAVIQGVRPCTTVTVSVYPEDVYHIPAAARPVRTKPKAPPMVDNLSIPSQSAQTFTLSWERPNTMCEITAYSITYSGVAKWGPRTEHTGSATIGRSDADTTTSIAIGDLQPYTHYNVTVVAASEAGWGKSATTQVGTGEAGNGWNQTSTLLLLLGIGCFTVIAFVFLMHIRTRNQETTRLFLSEALAELPHFSYISNYMNRLL